jgi:hypothetical protein
MEILTDAAFTNVEITDRLIFRDKTFIDSDRNLNAKTIHCDFLSCRNIHIEDAVVNDPTNFLNRAVTSELLYKDHKDHKDHKDLDDQNEALGEHAACLGGKYNEALGSKSVTLGGEENQASGEDAVAMGRAAFAKHDQSMVWNTGTEPLESTAPKQCLFASDGGMFFKLPRSTDVPTHMMPEGFACWCWDETRQTLMLKTKQKNVMYKTTLDTLQHEVSVSLTPNEETGRVELKLNNPDLV